MKFVWIDPGTFRMGSPTTEPEHVSDETPHQVTLTKGYRMSATLVTQYQWEQVMGSNPSHFKGKDEAEKKLLPVDNVSWFDCVEFCNKFSEKDNKMRCYDIASEQRDGDGRITSAQVTPLPNGTGYRLPTEAEWEYAARAGNPTAFWWGDLITIDQANYDGNYTYGPGGKSGEYRQKPTPVDFFPANPWGLHDMHGNLWQWCQDWYGPYGSGDVKDPVGIQKADVDARVQRGGSWLNNPGRCRAAYRGRNAPAYRNDYFGCRVVSRPD